MNFFGVVRNFCLLVVLGAVSTVGAMELVVYQCSQAEFVETFPSMTFEDALTNWTLILSGDARDQIEAAEAKRNNGKANLIFDMVRFLPSDVCTNTIRLFCDNDKAKIKFVSGLSIRDFAKLAWAQDVYDCKRCPNFNTCIRKRGKGPWMKSNEKKPFSLESIFKYAGSIALVDRHYNEDSLSLETIKLLDTVFSEIDQSDKFNKPIQLRKKFAYKKRYCHYILPNTLPNFCTAFNERFYDSNGNSTLDMVGIKIASAAIIGSLLSRFMRINYCESFADSVLENEKRSTLNELINASEHAEVLSCYIQPLSDPHRYSFMDICKMGLPCMGPVLVGCQQMLSNSSLSPRVWGSVVVGGILGSFLCMIFAHNYSDRSMLIGSATCASLLAGYVVISSVMQMRKVRSEKIPWDKLDELLKKHTDGHIVIE